MEEISRKNHANFTEYQEFIVAHPNYDGLHFSRNKNNAIRWVVTGKSDEGQKRRTWWIEKCNLFGIKVEAGAFAKIAVFVHPTKKHTCQICGRELSVEYVYPNANLLKKLKENFQVDFQPFERDISEIIDFLGKNDDVLVQLTSILKAPKNIQNTNELKTWISESQTKIGSKSFLSPGVMSNPPDRYDGFHSDGNCCRSKSDKGRHKENMQRYGQDRRVYENWADGDWKQADRLMSEFRKVGLSADHIGPISLGFCHRPKFHPLSKEENFAKNNRMSLNDVTVLIADEQSGEQVISWHSKYLWDSLKNKVKNDKDAVKLSALMRTNLHGILTIFSMINEEGFRDFLMQFLNLDYSDFDYTFPDFIPNNIGKVVKTVKKGKNQANNKERYIRVAFESLEEYKNKDNRKVACKPKKKPRQLNNLKKRRLIDYLIKANNIQFANFTEILLKTTICQTGLTNLTTK